MWLPSLLVSLPLCVRLVSAATAPSPPLSLSKYDQEIFDVSMQIGDWSWEPSTGWIESDDDANGHTSTRFTAWYAVGLLQRNQGEDVQNAITAIKNVMSVQFTDPIWNGTPWFWDYKVSSDVPPPNNATYPPVIYSSYDPNWAYFVGAQFVQIISEFENLLPADLVEEMVQSMYMAARNLMTRVGYNGDNLVTAYTNPALGRALLVKWVGHRIGDHNLTHAGRQYAQDIYDLFTADGYNTFGEYNAPTYYGEDVLMLCQWIRHAPPNSNLPGHAKYMLQKLWDDIALHYNYNLKNMVGPYDRVYHRNMLIDDSIISNFFWLLLGRDVSPVPPIGMDSSIFDLRQGAAFALVGQTLRDNIKNATVQKLVTPVTKDRLFTKYIRDSLDNDTTRVTTSWVSKNLMAGGQQVAELYNRGNQFTPLIVHWKSGNTSLASRPYVSFFQLYDTASTVNVTVTPYHLSVTYPITTLAGTTYFRYLIGDIPAPYWAAGQNMNGFENLPCLNVSITSQGLNGTIVLGKYATFTIQSNNFWTVDYYVDPAYDGIPSMDFDLTYTC